MFVVLVLAVQAVNAVEFLVTRNSSAVDGRLTVQVLDLSSSVSLPDLSRQSRNHHLYILEDSVPISTRLSLIDPSQISVVSRSDLINIDPKIIILYADTPIDESLLTKIRNRPEDSVAILMSDALVADKKIQYLFDFNLIVKDGIVVDDPCSLVVPAASSCKIEYSDAIHVSCGSSSSVCALPSRAIRFSFLGDWGAVGEGLSATARRVNAEVNDFIIFGGDNIYETGIASTNDPKMKEIYLDNFGNLTIPQYVILGNHDRFGNHMAQLVYSQYVPGRWVADFYYYMRRVNVRGTSLCTIFLDTNDLNMSGQMAFLHAALKTCQQDDWIIVSGHHPVFSTGGHGDSGSLRSDLQPVLDAYRVDLYLSGHDHTMSVHEEHGTTYIVSGAASKKTTSSWLTSTSAAEITLFSTYNVFGFTRVEVKGNKLEFVMINSVSGESLFSLALTSRKSQRQSNAESGIAVPELGGARSWSSFSVFVWTFLIVVSWFGGTFVIKPLDILKSAHL